MPEDDYFAVRLILALGETIASTSPSTETQKHITSDWFASCLVHIAEQPVPDIMRVRVHVLICLLYRYHGSLSSPCSQETFEILQLRFGQKDQWDTDLSLVALSLFYFIW